MWGSMTLKMAMELPEVDPQVLYGIERNVYAAELARVSIWIGEIQWMLNNGFHYLDKPILRPLNNIENGDAVVDRTDPEHAREPVWPAAEFIVGNPPHKHNKHMRESGMTDDYVRDMFDIYKGRVGAESDYACYWFEKARQNIANGVTKRVGLIGPQGIRGGANRKVLDRIKDTGDIFLAWSDRPWVLDAAHTHVSLIGFDDGAEQERFRDGVPAPSINADLTVGLDLTKVPGLAENLKISFMGDTPGGKFNIAPDVAEKMLGLTNPHGKPNSDVVVPWVSGSAMKNPREAWIIDFGIGMTRRTRLYTKCHSST